MLIIFEGADYTGKTTLSKKLAEKIKTNRLSIDFNEVKDMEKDIKLQEFSAVSFGASLVYTQVHDLLGNVIKDRSYMTEFIYSKHNINGQRESRKGFFNEWLKRIKEKEHIFIHTTAPIKVIRERMRKLNDGDIELDEIKKIIGEYKAILNGSKVDYIEVDTSKDIDENIDKIIKAVKKIRRHKCEKP